MNWTTTAPTAPGVYLWRAKGDRMKRWRLLDLVRDKKGRLRVDDQQSVAYDGRWLIGKTARSLRGEWIGPIGENSRAT